MKKNKCKFVIAATTYAHTSTGSCFHTHAHTHTQPYKHLNSMAVSVSHVVGRKLDIGWAKFCGPMN